MLWLDYDELKEVIIRLYGDDEADKIQQHQNNLDILGLDESMFLVDEVNNGSRNISPRDFSRNQSRSRSRTEAVKSRSVSRSRSRRARSRSRSVSSSGWVSVLSLFCFFFWLGINISFTFAKRISSGWKNKEVSTSIADIVLEWVCIILTTLQQFHKKQKSFFFFYFFSKMVS